MTALPTRRLGELEISALGLGCMGMSRAYGRGDRAGGIATIRHALERGVTLIDTADIYGRGGNERLVGEAIRHRRRDVVLATKFGILTHPLTGLPTGINARPERALRCLDQSLARLGVDHVDLWYLHRADPSVPIEETVGAMARAVETGKVRAIGLSEASATTLRRAAAVHPIAAVQSEWSIFSRDVEDDVVPAAAEVGAGIVAYAPLGRGMLTGSARASTRLPLIDYRRTLPRWRREHRETNTRLVARVQTIARSIGATPSQTALAWLLQRSQAVVPIPGTKHTAHLQENLGALEVHLPEEVVTELDTIHASGDRYPDMTWIAGDTP